MRSFFKNKRILVFEPNEEERVFLRGMLQSWGCTSVFESESIVDAMAIIEQEHPDIIVGDDYAVGDTCDLLRITRESGGEKKTPFIITTRKSDYFHVRRAIDLGARGYLLKPYDPFVLKQQFIRILHS